LDEQPSEKKHSPASRQTASEEQRTQERVKPERILYELAQTGPEEFLLEKKRLKRKESSEKEKNPVKRKESSEKGKESRERKESSEKGKESSEKGKESSVKERTSVEALAKKGEQKERS
jgi:hypothetical protein